MELTKYTAELAELLSKRQYDKDFISDRLTNLVAMAKMQGQIELNTDRVKNMPDLFARIGNAIKPEIADHNNSVN